MSHPSEPKTPPLGLGVSSVVLGVISTLLFFLPILATPIGKAAWHSKPSWFVIASNDHAIAPEQEASTAERMGAKTLTLASSHLPML